MTRGPSTCLFKLVSSYYFPVKGSSCLIHAGQFVIQLHYSDLLAESLKMYNGPLSSSPYTHHHGDPNSDDIIGASFRDVEFLPFPLGRLEEGYALVFINLIP